MVTKREQNRINKKNLIIEYLNSFGRSPTSKISVAIGLPSPYMNKILNELLVEQRVLREQETNSTYWTSNDSLANSKIDGE